MIHVLIRNSPLSSLSTHYHNEVFAFENSLEGNAATTIDRTNYGGILPFRLPRFVDYVAEEIILEFDFVAVVQ